ncbi:MAG: ATP synthase F1 subunit gamma [Desulfobacterales bacterium]|nr:ATP synthase F1 subunit gamma [Desulfobacterales bacterium]
MATLKDVQNKIGAVKKTKQITRAMNMVAASKLRGAQSHMEAFRPYATKFAEVLESLSRSAGNDSNPLLVAHENTKKVNIVLCTSDRGLCGGFNTSIVEKALSFAREAVSVDREVSFTTFGKKGRNWCRKMRFAIDSEYLDVVGSRIGFEVASRVGKKLINGFLEGTYDEVYLIYPEFISFARQVPVVKKILPMTPIETQKDEETERGKPYVPEHICEPSSDELLAELLPRNVYVQLYSALLETSTSEHAARMAAMNNATKACKDMIDDLVLAYNKARQAAITSELMDIVGGAEALSG